MSERFVSGPPILLDGPTGTELERLGSDTSGPLWATAALMEGSDRIRSVHEAYVGAGAEVLTAVTFRAHRRAFLAAGHDEEAWRVNVDKAVAIARDVAEHADHQVWVSGAQGPLGDCYRVDEVPDDAALRREHGIQADALATAGCDLILVETMGTIREAVAAVQAARATGSQVFVSFVVQRGGRLLSGEPLQAALDAVGALSDAQMVNCAGVDVMEDAMPVLGRWDRPWGVYANGSHGDAVHGWGPRTPTAAYAEAGRRWVEAGARLVGGCCGTGPGTIRDLAEMCRHRASS